MVGKAASTTGYREFHRRRIPRFLFEYIDGEPSDEVTPKRNLAKALRRTGSKPADNRITGPLCETEDDVPWVVRSLMISKSLSRYKRHRTSQHPPISFQNRHDKTTRHCASFRSVMMTVQKFVLRHFCKVPMPVRHFSFQPRLVQ
jgi:hypothetical protein